MVPALLRKGLGVIWLIITDDDCIVQSKTPLIGYISACSSIPFKDILLASLAYPWPEHDGSALPVGVYACENGPTLTIEADRVTFPLDDRQTALFFLGRAEEGGGCVSCCGMKDGELRMLLRVLNAPFTLDITCRFAGDTVEMHLSGVGQEGKTFTLTKKP